MLIFDCNPLSTNPHTHEFSDDWILGGPEQCDPTADPRYQPASYTYYNADLTELWTTSVPFCDDEALYGFTYVATIANSDPKYISVKRPGEKMKLLPWYYDPTTDEIYRKEDA
jgi:hypothetical protein